MSLSILITLLIVIITALLNVKKKGTNSRKPAPVAPQQGQNCPPPPPSKMQNFETNSPKNENYFTYETLNPEDFISPSPSTILPDSSVENYQQTTENERQSKVKLNLDEEEIKKGIIYSIILEKPEF